MCFLTLYHDGQLKKVWALQQGSCLWWHVDGRAWKYDFSSTSKNRSKKQSQNSHEVHSGCVQAPLPGKVLKVLVANKQPVKKNQTLIIIEAMKMEHTLKAPFDGQVQGLNCQTGQQVSHGQDLLRITP